GPEDSNHSRADETSDACSRQRLPLPRLPKQAIHRPHHAKLPPLPCGGGLGVGAHWANGGETKLGNLVSLCRFHHRAVHEGGIQVVILDDGAFRFIKPNGDTVDSIAEGFTQPLSDWTELPAANAERGIHIDNKTAATRWCGETMDYGLGIEVLLQKYRKAKRVSAETSER